MIGVCRYLVIFAPATVTSRLKNYKNLVKFKFMGVHRSSITDVRTPIFSLPYKYVTTTQVVRTTRRKGFHPPQKSQ